MKTTPLLEAVASVLFTNPKKTLIEEVKSVSTLDEENLLEASLWGTPYKGDYENVFFLDDLSGNYKHFINLAKRGVTFQTAHVAHVNDIPKLPDSVKKYTWFIFDKPQSFDTALALVPVQ